MLMCRIFYIKQSINNCKDEMLDSQIECFEIRYYEIFHHCQSCKSIFKLYSIAQNVQLI